VFFTLPINEALTTPNVRRLYIFVFAVFVLSFGRVNAQEPTIDRERYYSAVDYCRQTAWAPIALSADKKILCFDGKIDANLDLSPAKELEPDGLFVVRSPGGNSKPAIELSNLLRDRHATVIAYDYCFSACAEYFLIASHLAYVLKGTLVAWHYPVSSDLAHPFCTALVEAHDGGPKRLSRGPCSASGDLALYGPNPAITQFFRDRTVSAAFEGPPDSRYVRKIISSIFAESHVYRDIAWTIHPRFYSHLFKTKIVYEAYPESQSEVDEMLARRGWNIRVIYDP
jgi:hypothetical protein